MDENTILQDTAVEIAKESADKLVKNLGRKLRESEQKFLDRLTNSQIRKFWNILKLDRNPEGALKLANHQLNKNDFKTKNFWQEVIGCLDTEQFKEKLKKLSGISVKSEKVLDLQVIYAETIYSELLYRKAIGE